MVFAILLLWPDIQTVIDGNVDTMPDMTRMVTALGLLGIGTMAKDGDKSSESLGIKK